MHPILITGISGFVGEALAKRLIKEGHFVIGISRRPVNELEALGAKIHYGDLTDGLFLKNTCKNISTVFHVAAKAGIWGKTADYYQANVIGTRLLLDACIANNVSNFIYTSTASVVFNQSPLVNANEQMPYGRKWLCPYAKTKAIAEKEVLHADHEGSIRSIALRPHLIWGPKDPHLFPRMIKRALRNRLIQVGNGNNWVDLTHIDNVVEAHMAAFYHLEKGLGSGQAYFITQEESVPLWPWMNDFLKSIGLPAVTKKVPLSVAYSIGGLLEGIYAFLPKKIEPPMTRFLALELAKDHTFSCKKAREELQYKPIISFAEGMAERISYWKKILNN